MAIIFLLTGLLESIMVCSLKVIGDFKLLTENEKERFKSSYRNPLPLANNIPLNVAIGKLKEKKGLFCDEYHQDAVFMGVLIENDPKNKPFIFTTSRLFMPSKYIGIIVLKIYSLAKGRSINLMSSIAPWMISSYVSKPLTSLFNLQILSYLNNFYLFFGTTPNMPHCCAVVHGKRACFEKSPSPISLELGNNFFGILTASRSSIPFLNES
ncbi:hypothetical protein BDF21DRAFT_403365 [Thamnidium elegans]|nr:hypothetical protein BDF21DRAFT_403365 [Thamnidium elegans]